ncbi:MAG TPA: hypothetical protein VGP68_24490 [Gemmataceae bacterium]|jgi:hypothetical protein|nr:hypothetical protein [Gemmataceae bacterium]
MMRKLLAVFVASAFLLGSVVPVNAGVGSVGNKPGHRHVQDGKKKHHKKGAKSGGKKGGKGKKKHGKIKG